MRRKVAVELAYYERFPLDVVSFNHLSWDFDTHLLRVQDKRCPFFVIWAVGSLKISFKVVFEVRASTHGGAATFVAGFWISDSTCDDSRSGARVTNPGPIQEEEAEFPINGAETVAS